jgi:hypothetical protein
MKDDNLFDAHITPLDVVKILLLIVTMFSTYNIVDLMTPNVPFAFVREFAAVGVIEGGFLGFEAATKNAKNIKQTQYATIGFFLSLTVIALFAGVSGLAEFGGETLLNQTGGQFMGLAWTVRDWVMLFALLVTVGWIFALAAIYRLYALADPDKKAELNRNQIYGDMKAASNSALAAAMNKARPTVTIQRALAQIREDYQGELSPAQLAALLADVEGHLKASTHDVKPTRPALAFQMTTPHPDMTRPATTQEPTPASEAVPVTVPPFLGTYSPNGHNPNGSHAKSGD